jgi:hypothetical protein
LETGRKSVHEDIHTLNIDGNLINNQQIISNTFNDHFLTMADRINNKMSNNLNFGKHNKYPMEYLLQICKNPFPNIKCNYTSTKEIKNIIKSLKSANSHGYDESSAKILKKLAPISLVHL